jgi:DNA repair exonuclease SbcCD nuclease subunit
MASFTFFTDPHLGKKLRSHTTTASQQKFADLIYQQALSIVETASNPPVCLGDLFDQYSNREDILEQGYELANRCMKVLQGNHDVKNLKTEPSSLEFLSVVTRDGVIVQNPDPSEPCVSWSGPLCFIPHHFSQEAFEAALKEAMEQATKRSEPSILCLHCNVMEKPSDDPSLYLVPEMEEKVRKVFGLVLVGHEHVPKHKIDEGLCDLIVMGNTIPLGFGEMADRFTYEVCIKDGSISVERSLIWYMSAHYQELDVEHFMTQGHDPDKSFIKLTGSISHELVPELNKMIVKTWKESTNLIALNKDHVEIVRPNAELHEQVDLSNLESLLKDAAEKAGFAELFQEIADEIVDA